jgi:hypothetical protein
MTRGAYMHKEPGLNDRIIAYKKQHPQAKVGNIAIMFCRSKAFVSKVLRDAGLGTYRKVKA